MARTTWLLNRNGRYYLQCRVPSDLIEIIGKKLIKKSLYTADRMEALERLAPEAAEVSELFAAARRKIKTEVENLTPDLTDSEAKRLAYIWFKHRERESAEDAFRDPASNPAALEEARFLLGELLSGDDESLIIPLIQQTVDSVLIEAGFPSKPVPTRPGPIQLAVKRRIPDVDKDSAAYQGLCDHIKRGMIENIRRQQQRLKGQPTVTIDPAFHPEAVEKDATGPLLSKILELWLAERKPPAQTERDWRLVVRRFTELHDDLSVDTISKAHVREFKDALLQIPKVLPRKIQKLPLPKILAAPETTLSIAEDAANKAIELEEFSPDGFSLLACVKAQQAKFDEAVEFGRKSVSLAPKHAPNIALYTVALVRAGKYQEALQQINRAIRLSPIYPAWYLHILGSVSFALGDDEQAVSAYRACVEATDADSAFMPHVRVWLAICLANTGHDAEARAVSAEVLRLDSKFRIEDWWQFPRKDWTVRERAVPIWNEIVSS